MSNDRRIRRRIRRIAAGLIVGSCFCLPQLSMAQDRGGTETHGGLFSAAEARALRARWDYVEGWFGGEVMRYAFLNMDRLFSLVEFDGGDTVRTLAEAPRLDVAGHPVNTKERGLVTLDDYVTNDPRVNGFIIIDVGEIVYERYPHMRPVDKHIYFSISKMFTGLVISKLQDQGLLDVRKAIDRYVAALAGTSWDGITIRNILDMASGIGCYENNDPYGDINSCFAVMDRSVGFHPNRPPIEFRSHIAAAPAGYEQGRKFDYTSANTNVLMYLAEVVTGKTYPQLLSELIWAHVGAESSGLIVSGDYAEGQAAAAHGGIITTLRDLGRFGVFMLGETAFHDKLLSDARPELRSEDDDFERGYATADEIPTHNAWQCDVVFADGDFGKGGYGGQFLYLSPRRDLVIAWFGAFGEDLLNPDLESVARQLSSSGLFAN